MIDAVLSYHLNPHTCGVAKFNQRLAKELDVPCLPLSATRAGALVSIKPSELHPSTRVVFTRPYDLLLHDRTMPADHNLIACARRVFYADEIGCPSTLQGNPHRAWLNVLLFGMAHKIDVHTVYVTRLRELLDRSGCGYTVSVSTAVHEGSPWDASFEKTETNLRKVFGDKLRVLGYLADDALAKELQDCQMAALFFDPAARANNTSLWAAMEAGAAVLTNLDARSPGELVHRETVFDLKRLTDWPIAALRDQVAQRGHEAVQGRSWAKLVEILRAA